VSGAEADGLSHELIVSLLHDVRPDDPVLSEEGKDDAKGRLSARRVWIVDPLDGTREYAEGRTDWAVHVALWEDGELVAGAVAGALEGAVLSTADPPPVPESTARTGRPFPRLVVSRTRAPDFVDRVAVALGGAEVMHMGSAGAKAAAVIVGFADAYVHAGGQYEWDSAAPVAVARSAGLHTSRIDGSLLRYNQPDVYLPDLVICRPELAATILAAISHTPAG